MRILIRETVDKIGEEVELKGWVNGRRDHGKLIFIDLRDRSGLFQLVFSPASRAYESAAELRAEWIIGVRGKISLRPETMINPNLVTGKIEMAVEEMEIISKAETPPIAIDTDGREVSEDVRMHYRYLDLRRERMANNLRQRYQIIKFMREFLAERDFVEIETPMLGRSTPEGARDYLVPSRLHPGNFYALPQSPQQYKQLLMVAGFERYFQIARCLRDEDPRGDRQPEFTQLDLEMSFGDEEEIISLVEKLYLDLVRKLYPEKKIKLDRNGRIPRMPYAEAMEKYGNDKPDIRENKDDPDELAFLFVVDFPMFEWKEEEKRWDAVHHPFTQPRVESTEDFWEIFKKDPAAIRAKQYDFVLNGYEIGGGSIRINDPRLLSAVFEAMGNSPAEIQEKFGHMLEAFRYGVPPHGGMAPGIDRFAMLMQNEPNIREVIAFPKTGDGRDLLTGAPAPVRNEQLKELKIKIIE
jgi:aspartyl-tRNA synthetase